MLVELGIGAIFYGLSEIYHRYIQYHPKPPRDPVEPLQIPATEQGTPKPLVFGRFRVRRPILVWYGELQAVTNPDEFSRVYAVDMLFSFGIGLGSGFTRGNSLAGNKLWNVWWGDQKLTAPASGLPVFDGANTYYGQNVFRPYFGGTGFGGWIRGAYYWHGGWTDQDLNSPPSRIGDRYTAAVGDASLIPGFAKEMLVSFVRLSDLSGLDPYTNQTLSDASVSSSGSFPDNGFVIGESNSVSSVSAEVSTYGDITSGATGHIFSMTKPGIDFGGDADPAEVLYDFTVGALGKLGLPTSLIDMDYFMAASQTLKSEGHGVSGCVDSTRDAGEWVDEILKQIDGVLRFNRATRKIELKLIRPDFNPPDLPVINRKNCSRLENAAMSGWPNGVNAVRVVFPNRELDYEDDSEAAQNPADSEEGPFSEEVVHFPFCTRAALAQPLAGRELAWRSQPLMKLTAHVDRSFLRYGVGDAIVLNWTDPNISNVIFRIAAKNDGKLTDPEIVLTLVQDVNYVYRSQAPRRPDFGTLGDPRFDSPRAR